MIYLLQQYHKRSDLTVTPKTICIGQTIVKSTLDPSADCNDVAQPFNVATGDVQAATGDDNSEILPISIHLPAPRSLQQLATACNSPAASFFSTNLNVPLCRF